MQVNIPKFPAFFSEADKAVIGTLLNKKRYPNCIRSFSAIVNESGLPREEVLPVLEKYRGIFLLEFKVDDDRVKWKLNHQIYLLVVLHSNLVLSDVTLRLLILADTKEESFPQENISQSLSCSASADAEFELASIPVLDKNSQTTVEALDEDEADEDDDEKPGDDNDKPDESQSFTA